MRLKTEYIQLIKQAVRDYFGEDASVYLFGSRKDDQKKGGDIDLYIETKKKDTFNRKIKMLKMLQHQMGDRKIDIVVNNATASLYIYEVARKEGILL